MRKFLAILIKFLTLGLVIVVAVSLIWVILPQASRTKILSSRFFASVYALSEKIDGSIGFINTGSAQVPLSPQLPFSPGERLTFEVSLKGVKIGKAVLTFRGEESLDGKQVYFVTFDTSTPYFKDLERIFAFPGTFLPLRVERRFKRFAGVTTTAIESYDQDKFLINIKKRSAFKSLESNIEKKSKIHNAILLGYYLRTISGIESMKPFSVNLPTKEFELKFKGRKIEKTLLGEKDVYIFEGSPYKFTIWLEADSKLTPLKISGASTLGYSLDIKSIEQVDEFIDNE